MTSQGALPDAQRMLHPGRETEGLVEGPDLSVAGPAAIAPTGQADLTREGHDTPRRPAAGIQDATTNDVAAGHRRHRLERADDLAPQLPASIGQGDPDGRLQRADVGTVRLQSQGERNRGGDRLHGERLRLLVA